MGNAVSSNRRALTPWETTITERIATLGFRYYPHPKGGGYWLIPEQYKGEWAHACGLQVTYDLDVGPRGLGAAHWTLHRVQGLKIYQMRLGIRKRTDEKQADELFEKLEELLKRSDWKRAEGWYLDSDFDVTSSLEENHEEAD